MQRTEKKSTDNLIEPKKQQKQKKQKEDQSYWEMMIDGIVRPPRAKYQERQLGNRSFSYHNKEFIREQRELRMQGKKIQLTLYLAKNTSKYIILYMHGNSSCRVEALGLIRQIPPRISLASFDFMGCGKNQETDTITLGYREAQQADFVTKYLQKQGYKVILWGRSMGAATALMYGQAQFIVADSSYKSFKSLCKQVAKQHSPAVVPNFMVNCFFPCVFGKLRKDVDKKAKYDVQDLDVRQAVKKLDPKTRIVFMSGDKDNLIHPRNSEKLYNACPCEKKFLKIFSGDHNSRRPDQVMEEVMSLIEDYISENHKNQLKLSPQQIEININY